MLRLKRINGRNRQYKQEADSLMWSDRPSTEFDLIAEGAKSHISSSHASSSSVNNSVSEHFSIAAINSVSSNTSIDHVWSHEIEKERLVAHLTGKTTQRYRDQEQAKPPDIKTPPKLMRGLSIPLFACQRSNSFQKLQDSRDVFAETVLQRSLSSGDNDLAPTSLVSTKSAPSLNRAMNWTVESTRNILHRDSSASMHQSKSVSGASLSDNGSKYSVLGDESHSGTSASQHADISMSSTHHHYFSNDISKSNKVENVCQKDKNKSTSLFSRIFRRPLRNRFTKRFGKKKKHTGTTGNAPSDVTDVASDDTAFANLASVSPRLGRSNSEEFSTADSLAPTHLSPIQSDCDYNSSLYTCNADLMKNDHNESELESQERQGHTKTSLTDLSQVYSDGVILEPPELLFASSAPSVFKPVVVNSSAFSIATGTVSRISPTEIVKRAQSLPASSFDSSNVDFTPCSSNIEYNDGDEDDEEDAELVQLTSMTGPEYTQDLTPPPVVDRWTPSPSFDDRMNVPKRPNRKTKSVRTSNADKCNQNPPQSAFVNTHEEDENFVPPNIGRHSPYPTQDFSLDLFEEQSRRYQHAESQMSLFSGVIAQVKRENEARKWKEAAQKLKSCLKGPITTQKAAPLSVSFDKIRINSYERIVGDNPACTSGPPISIGWKVMYTDELSLNDYERQRGDPRDKRYFYLTLAKRKHLLCNVWGVTDEEIRDARLENAYIQYCRVKSISLRNKERSRSKLGDRPCSPSVQVEDNDVDKDSPLVPPRPKLSHRSSIDFAQESVNTYRASVSPPTLKKSSSLRMEMSSSRSVG